jgi:hypothetical protein
MTPNDPSRAAPDVPIPARSPWGNPETMHELLEWMDGKCETLAHRLAASEEACAGMLVREHNASMRAVTAENRLADTQKELAEARKSRDEWMAYGTGQSERLKTAENDLAAARERTRSMAEGINDDVYVRAFREARGRRRPALFMPLNPDGSLMQG